jgi:hypothetical protein
MRRRRVHGAEGTLAQVVPWAHGSGDPAPRPQVQEAHQPGSLLHHGERFPGFLISLFVSWKKGGERRRKVLFLFPSSMFLYLI